uniref:kinetochore protein NDC80 homolog n=1 Tax=Erigeron canadensis TaxID=72917 RepID=UPI001CB928AD|nr:kinetochore protein NDC80 homolog [Erigeron canadensis]
MRGPPARRPPPSDRQSNQFTTPTPTNPYLFSTTSRRDSDASFCSSRPSISNSNPNHRATAINTSDRSFQLHAVSTINSYLSNSSFHVHLKLKPLPSNKDIIETLKFIVARLDRLIDNNNNNNSNNNSYSEEEIFLVLKIWNCPVKITKSALKAPGTPHSFPSVLGVLYWLVQLDTFTDNHIVNDSQSRLFTKDAVNSYTLNTYLHYIRGDDDAMEAEDEHFMAKLQKEKNSVEENVNMLEANVKDLEGKLEAMKSGPTLRETKEEEKSLLEKDVVKFNGIIEQLQVRDANMEKQIEEQKKEMGVKKEETNRTLAENEELTKKVEEQSINMRDAERMKRELQLVERDVGEAEIERNQWEEKCWDVNTAIGTKLKEIQALQIECNQAIRRLKLENDIHYELNAKGSTVAEVLGIDYKSTLKPALASNSDEIKKTSLENFETQIHLQQASREIEAKIDAKRNRMAMLQSRIDELENQLNLMKNGTQDYISRCAMEARRSIENAEAESHDVDAVEKEAREVVETSKARLQETKVQYDDEVQMCEHELFKLIDTVSKYKEFTVSKLTEMENDVAATAAAIAQAHNDSVRSSIKNYPNK